MGKIACIICNYNKYEFAVKCVKSLLEQTMTGIDIFVVDNASTDGSVEILRERYGRQITVIANKENLGGSGGFNTGLRLVLNEDIYQYVVLIDNDVFLEKSAIQKLYDYMESHRDVGILGPKILQMAYPDTVQDLGGSITENYRMHGNYNGMKDFQLPEELDCAYISTCTAMARIDAVKQFGLMPEENFIYWDDVEWSKKCQLAGYRTVAISSASVWHNHSIIEHPSGFTKYYLTRNMLHFFAKYMQDSEVHLFVEHMLSEIFALLYGYYNKGMDELLQATMFAFDDFIHLNFGKADDEKIMLIQDRLIPFERVIIDKDKIEIGMIDNFRPKDELDIFHILLYVIGKIQKKTPRKKIWVSLQGCGYSEKEFFAKWQRTVEVAHPSFFVPEIIVSGDKWEFDLRMQLCQHVRLVSTPVLPVVYVDQYCNCITSEQDYAYFTGYETNEAFFKGIYRPLMERSVRKIREQMK